MPRPPAAPRPGPAWRGAAAHPLSVAAHLVGPRPGRLDALIPHQRCHQVPQQVQARPRAEPEAPVDAAMRDGGRHRQPHLADRPTAPATAASQQRPGAAQPAGNCSHGHSMAPTRNGPVGKAPRRDTRSSLPGRTGSSWSTRHRNAFMPFLSISEKGDSTASPGKLFQCSVTRTESFSSSSSELPAHRCLLAARHP